MGMITFDLNFPFYVGGGEDVANAIIIIVPLSLFICSVIIIHLLFPDHVYIALIA